MAAFARGDEEPMREVAALKVKVVRRRAGEGSYLEANHAFVKGYGWFLPELLGPENLAVIYLRRAPELVAKSLVRVRGVPGRTSWSRLWYSAPGQARNLAEPEPGADALALGCWYAEEIERQAAAYQERFPDVLVVEVSLEQLNDFDFVLDLFQAQFGLEVDEVRLREAVGTHTSDLNREFVAPPDLSHLELRNPDELPPEEGAQLLREVAKYLCEGHEAELRIQEEGAVGQTILTSILRVVTGQASQLAVRFQVEIPNTTFEIDLIMKLLKTLRPLDLMGLLIVRRRDGTYDLPAANSDGGLASVVPVIVGSALRRSPLLLWSLAGLAIVLATIAGYALSLTL